MNSEDHARYGRLALVAGTPDYGLNGEGEAGKRTDVVDTVTNIMHYVHEEGLGDFDAIVQTATRHFEEELFEEEEEKKLVEAEAKSGRS